VSSRARRPLEQPASRLLLALIAIGLFTTWALAIARYGGPDEPGHVLRAEAVADGHLLGATVPGLVSGFRAVTAPAGIATGDPRCFRHDKRTPATCARPDPGATGLRRVASSAGTNPPWYYAVVGLPVRLFGDVDEAAWYRVVAAALFALTVAVALARVRLIDPARGVLVVTGALSPVAWFLGGVVNPSSLEIGLAVVAWIGVERLRLVAAVGWPDMLWIGVPTGLAILVRPIGVVAVVTMLIVIRITRQGASALGGRRWVALLTVPAVAGVASFAWSRWSSVEVSDTRAATRAPLAHVFGEVVVGTADTVHELGGSLGWLEYSAPWPAQWAWWLAVVACGVAAWRGDPRRRAAWIFVAGCTALFPIAFETALANRLGYIWQGRYSIPTAIGLVVVGSSTWVARLSQRAVGVLLGAVAVAEVATLWTALRRYAVGTHGSWFFTDARWHPPLPPFVLLAANAVLVVALLAVASRPRASAAAPSSVSRIDHAGGLAVAQRH